MTHKTLLLAGLTAVSLLFNALNAYAKVGDTVERTNQLYGKLLYEVEGAKVYSYGDLAVAACFDGAGICQALIFFQVNGRMPQDTIHCLDNINIPSGVVHWKQLDDYSTADGTCHYWAADSLNFIICEANYTSKGLPFRMRGYTTLSLRGTILSRCAL
jgi:hypothetical protein